MPTPNFPVAATPQCDEPPVPALGQCLFCYLEDVVATHGCAGHQHSERWGDAQPVPMPGSHSVAQGARWLLRLRGADERLGERSARRSVRT